MVQAPALIPTSDEEEAVGLASSDASVSSGAEILPVRTPRHTLFGRAPRKRIPARFAQPAPQAPAPQAPAPSTPRRRSLRARKITQIHPYTLEALRYRRELYKNNWEDAVVSQRESRRLALAQHAELGSWHAQSDADDEGSERENGGGRSRSSSPILVARSHTPVHEIAARASPQASPSPPHESDSGDSTDYERRFRVLKRMMPARMARACIDDLRAMRHGEAYDDAGEVPRRASPSAEHALRPGESRKRRGHVSPDAPLISDADDSTDTEPASPPPLEQESDLRAWMAPNPLSPPRREVDAIDQMLVRAKSSARGFGQQTMRSTAQHAKEPARPKKKHAGAQMYHVYVHGQERIQSKRGDLQGAAHVPILPSKPRLPRTDMRNHAALLTFSTQRAMPTLPHPVPRTQKRSVKVPAPLAGVTQAPPTPPVPATSPHALPPSLADALQELHAWDTLAHFQMDFGIAPPPLGMRFATFTPLARGQLHSLLHPSSSIPEPSTYHLFGHDVHLSSSMDEMEQTLPAVWDALWDAAQECDTTSQAHDLFFFLGVWLTWQTRLSERPTVQDDFSAQRAATYLCDQIEAIFDRGIAHHGTRLALLWFRVQVLWRLYAASEPEVRAEHELHVLEAAQPLMAHLLADGIHKCIEALRTAPEQTSYAAQLWINLAHLLHSMDENGAAFWDVLCTALDASMQLAPASGLLWAERAWYVLFAVQALAHFGAAAGVAGSHTLLHAHWPFVLKVLRMTRLRFDERVERAAPRALLFRRDAYIHILLRRCMHLASAWRWSLVHADGVLAWLFDIFDAYRLKDLPSEQDHDFAPFLRRFDIALLLQGAPLGTAYHVFLQLLARAAHARKAACIPSEADRSLSRLFSRMTPVRIMPFSRTNIPTAAERAMLFNHYSMVMLFLYFVPSTAVQRLRQIRSFLSFRTADRLSQLTCIRAMVYAGALFRHHALPLDPVLHWFVDVCRMACSEHAELHAQVPAVDAFAARRNAAEKKEAIRILVVLLRSIQHLTLHGSLDAQAPPAFPPPGLLQPTWTDELLRHALECDHEVDVEILRVIRTFLHQREAVTAPLVALEEDALWTDPALAVLLGEDAPDLVPAPRHDAMDYALAQALHTRISPAIFAAMTNTLQLQPKQSSRTPGGDVEELVRYAKEDEWISLLVECWAGAAHVLVQHDLRDWSAYLTLGNESWKRLADPIKKRDIALRFVVNMAKLDPSAYTAHRMECLAVWFQCIAARDITFQPFLSVLLMLGPGEPLALFDGAAQLFWDEPVPSSQHAAHLPPLDTGEFVAKRLQLLQRVLCNLGAVQNLGTGFVIQCVSALLSSVRIYLETTIGEERIRYAAFASELLASIRALDPVVLRGVGVELHATALLVQGKL
ncbi:hypothetical protein MVES1_002439 [Malassezia vespertilionis]|uniref:uncharacterized protein n=1 Tax=Malassezia vespertilionis TaxID=2020962 RepID=UPI0024B1B921|nr:uncharacterized protein MVES1_002439 [Malassezia vespertilionis]WFD07083.1 hypothetical protein MVES1_002439 [Malassezia vespertilionis]